MPELVAGLSVVVPVYNSQGTLAALIERLEPVLRGLTDRFEAVLVNDGSRDESWRVIRELSAKYPWVGGLDLMRNYGQHNALLCGIRAARFDTIVTIDDDLQNPPEEIPHMLGLLKEGHDVVYGYPAKQRHGLLRDMASVITKWTLQKTMGAQTARRVSAFRVFRTELRSAFANYRSPLVSIDVLLTWATSKFAAIEVRHDARAAGVSNYTLFKLFTHAMNMMTGFTTFPLQLASIAGFAMTMFGALLLAYVVIRYLFSGSSVPGFPFLASVISLFSGVQLFALGIIGEYLARLHVRTMGKPVYTVRGSAGAADAEVAMSHTDAAA